ncbi:leishmanolysin-related zinc metalloendopeptidase [Kitasatospora sp. NPDC093806]|uniref:leishmanolysin-related zinc metalloendopeptidase n=1 Tax=Kitasatospora sp. NPDC093806 TaxID=3155075 RepID=UPI0034325552
MNTHETHIARADREAAKRLAATDSPFTIEVEFLGGLSETQRNAFKKAADRWARVIVGDLPNVDIGRGRIVDDLLVRAKGEVIDGIGTTLGETSMDLLRPPGSGPTALLPVTATMSFDTADLAAMEAEGILVDVITHEMGHALGIGGEIWMRKRLLLHPGSSNPVFVGPQAQVEFAALVDGGAPRPVPVENTGGAGTADAHWRETVFDNELMTGFVNRSKNPLSRVTAASLQDIGYIVDLDAADPYELPNHFELAVSGRVHARTAPIDRGVVIHNAPEVMPAERVLAA